MDGIGCPLFVIIPEMQALSVTDMVCICCLTSDECGPLKGNHLNVRAHTF